MKFIRSYCLSNWMTTSTTWGIEHKSYVSIENGNLLILCNKENKLYKYIGMVSAEYGTNDIHRTSNFMNDVDENYGRYLALEHLQDIIINDIHSFSKFRDFIDDLSDREKTEGHWLTYQHGEYRFIVDRFLIHDILMILVIDENAISLKIEVYQLNN